MSEGVELSSDRFELADNIEATYELVCERGWGDGLPVIPPTEERVRRMLDSVAREPDEIIGYIPPRESEASIEKIAINAVMAGCFPECLPVLIAAVEAMIEPEFNLTALQTTTNPAGPLAIINGPIRKKLELNCKRGCLGPGWRANATIGRAIRLILINIGGAIPADVDKAIHGMPGKYTFCFGEDEEGSPWEPLHVERGIDRERSAVTMVGAQGTHNVLARSLYGETILRFTANSMCTVGNNNMLLQTGEPLAIFTSGHASILAGQGFTKAKCKEFIFEHVKVPVSEMLDCRAAGREVRVVNEMIQPCEKAEDIMIVVAGGPEPYHLVVLPTFGETKAVTKPIVLG